MSGRAAAEQTNARYVRGALFGLAAVLIWAANIVVAGLGLRSSLTPWDIAAIRFGVAGMVLLPYLLRSGLAFDRLGWIGWAALVLGGAPTVLLVNAGLLFAPASHAGALFPGVMPLAVAVLAAVVLKEASSRQRKAGFVLIAAGVVAIVSAGGVAIGTSQSIGDLLFLAAAFAFACYTVALRRAGLGGLHAAAISAVGSMLIYLPPYAAMAGAGIFDAKPAAILLQMLVQGLLTAVLSYVFYGRAVSILGASSGAAFAASCPAMTALMAIPVLGEWPSLVDWAAITAISAGVYLVSGGPMPRWLHIHRADASRAYLSCEDGGRWCSTKPEPRAK
jgi:drug/metabolite transporter (DMT)-like permease